MYNPNKYNYQPMQRVEVDGKRRYATPDGEKLPSVTTILDATKSEESKQALQNWRKRVGTAQAQAITTEAAGRGTRLRPSCAGQRRSLCTSAQLVQVCPSARRAWGPPQQRSAMRELPALRPQHQIHRPQHLDRCSLG